MPNSMRAVGIAEVGDLDVLRSFELPVPEPKPGEILVKVEYGGENFMDVLQRTGRYPMPSLPGVLGNEASGTIVKLPPDEETLTSEEFKKRNFKIGSRVALYYIVGAYAEYMIAPWQNAVVLPDEVSLRDGAAILIQGITAVTFIDRAYKVQRGEYYLVHTVAGGLGLCLAQLISARGGIVIGTTSTAEKAEIAKAHGAAHVILYKDEDVVARVLEITNGEGVHAIFDGVGKDTFDANFEMIRLEGTIVLLGSTSGHPPPFSPLILLNKNVKLLYPTAANYIKDPVDGRKYFGELYQRVADSKLKIIIQKEFPFTVEGVRDSQKALEQGKSVGKLLIKVV